MEMYDAGLSGTEDHQVCCLRDGIRRQQAESWQGHAEILWPSLPTDRRQPPALSASEPAEDGTGTNKGLRDLRNAIRHGRLSPECSNLFGEVQPSPNGPGATRGSVEEQGCIPAGLRRMRRTIRAEFSSSSPAEVLLQTLPESRDAEAKAIQGRLQQAVWHGGMAASEESGTGTRRVKVPCLQHYRWQAACASSLSQDGCRAA